MKILVFDTETTGLLQPSIVPIEKQPHIIEFFGLSIDENGEELGQFHRLYNPGYGLQPIITQVTGLKDKDLKDKPKLDFDEAKALADYVQSHDEIVAHNLSFDFGMLNAEFKRNDVTIKWPRLTCTVEATEYMLGYRMKLSVLYDYLFQEKFEGAHRAENDVRALARCFLALRKCGEI